VNAWKKACSSNGAVNLLVPKGNTYLLKSIQLTGPCNSILTVQVITRNCYLLVKYDVCVDFETSVWSMERQIFGTLSASQKRSDYKDISKWIMFDGVNSLSVDGGDTGVVDGNGETWWQNSCKRNKAKVGIYM